MVASLSRLVDTPPLDAAAVEEAYAHRPGELRANFVATLDGAVEIGGRSGSLGGEADRELFATMRALADVVLVGAGTARTEDYGPAWLTADRRQRRAARGQPPLPLMAVVSRVGDLDAAGRLFTERRPTQPEPPRSMVLTSLAAPEDKRAQLAAVADVRVLGSDTVDLAAAVASFRERGARILCEGGPHLFSDLLAAGLVDELCLTLSPFLAGMGHTTLTQGWTPAPAEAPAAFSCTDLFAGDGRLFARYRRDPA